MLAYKEDNSGNTTGTSQPLNGAHPAVCFANGFIYQVGMTNQEMVKINPTAGPPPTIVSRPALTGATIGGMTSRIRTNSNDGLIYIPCPATNQVIAYNPVGDSVSHIYTTGLDSPHDMIFAPGGINVAIQQGPTGLLQLTT